MEKSKFTQAEISAGRRLFNAWKRESPSMDFWDHLNKETKKGFRDSVDNSDVPPFKIVKSSTGGVFDHYDNLVQALEELVQLRDWKYQHGMDEHYLNAKETAWSNAEEALKNAKK